MLTDYLSRYIATWTFFLNFIPFETLQFHRVLNGKEEICLAKLFELCGLFFLT